MHGKHFDRWQLLPGLIDAYVEALPPGREPRILASRTVFVADNRKEALRLCEAGIRGTGAQLAGVRRLPPGCSIEEAVHLLDIHTGSPEDVIASLEVDSALARATDWTVQVHSIDPPHQHILRSIELIAQIVAPALGWQPAAASYNGRVLAAQP